MSNILKRAAEAVESILAKIPPRVQRTALPMRDEITSASVVIVSDDLNVRAKPADPTS